MARCYNRNVKVTTQRLPESQVLLEIEVDPEQMERSLDKAYRRLAQRVEVPGFRKGKDPADMLERHVGRDRVLHEAHEILIPEAYDQAIEEQDVDAIGQPSIELVNAEPLSFKATVPMRPTVDLGDYKNVSVEREPYRFQRTRSKGTRRAAPALRGPRARRAAGADRRYRPRRRAHRDRRPGGLQGRRCGVPPARQAHDPASRLRRGHRRGGQGRSQGDVSHRSRGRTATGGQERRLHGDRKGSEGRGLPELDDDFARQVGEGFASLAALRERILNDIRERVDAQAEEEFRDKAVGALVENARSIEFPPVLVDREIERLIEDQARNLGTDVEQYLATDQADAGRPSARPAAGRDRAGAPLAGAEAAGRRIGDQGRARRDRRRDRTSRRIGATGRADPQAIREPDGRAALKRSLLTRKTMDRLAEIASRTARRPPVRTSTGKEEGKDEGRNEVNGGRTLRPEASSHT